MFLNKMRKTLFERVSDGLVVFEKWKYLRGI